MTGPVIDINPQARAELRLIGREQHPLLIIDDFLLDPEAVVDFATLAPFGPPRAALYPGLNANLPDGYLQSVFPVLRPSFARGFGLPMDTPVHVSGFFALATHSLEQLQPRQRIPHYDFIQPGNLAVLHYLGRDQGGGTGFFRHNATGFELIDESRRDAYTAYCEAELAQNGERLGSFAGPHTPGFTLIDSVEARFNRLIVYRSAVLHCALFDGARLSEDPRNGRLTANTFVVPKEG